MEMLASFGFPSEARYISAMVAAGLVSVLLGYYLRSKVRGFFAAGASSALITAIILGTDEGDMAGLMTLFCSPIIGIVGGVLGCIAGAAGMVSSNRNRKQNESRCNS